MIIIILIIITVSIVLFFRLNPAFGRKYKGERLEKIKQSPNFKDGKFQNTLETPVQLQGTNYRKLMKEFLFNQDGRTPDKTIETKEFDKQVFMSQKEGLSLSWFGHSTAIINIDGYIILADPVFSERTSPVSFAGTKSFDYTHEFKLEDLPDIDAIIISHDHYDHLDYKTIKELSDRTIKFYVPLGIASHLERWGVLENNIVELDWWEEAKFGENLKLVSTPSRHFSGRTGMSNKTLWCSWVLKTENQSFYFSGDSGYGNHFKEIGEKYGPFNLAMLECGQYNERWPYIHMMPEQTVLANIDLKAEVMIPIHWGRFNLSLHKWTEPVERAISEASKRNVQILIPEIGDIYICCENTETVNWWSMNN